MTLTVQTTRFGELNLDEGSRLEFVEPILGFGGLSQYALYRPTPDSVFMWLQSMERPELAFVVCDPRLVESDYEVKARPDDVRSIELDDPNRAQVLAMVSYPNDPAKMTVNLMGPIVVNTERGLAKQLVLNDPRYTTKHKVFPDRT